MDEEGVEPWKMTHMAGCTKNGQWYLRAESRIFYFNYNVVEYDHQNRGTKLSMKGIQEKKKYFSLIS